MAFLSGLAMTFTGHVPNCVRYDEYHTRAQQAYAANITRDKKHQPTQQQ